METVWRALSSPHRRRILDLLGAGPCTTGQLSKEFTDLSRFAVMQHLAVLEEAGIVLARREGRSRWNYLNPIPLRELYERWIEPRASAVAETTLRLKRYAESTKEQEKPMDPNEYRHVKIELELRIQAPKERVFAALTTELNEWWPHRYKEGSTVYFEPEIGGKTGERFANGGGALYGVVVYLDAPHKVITTGPSSLASGMDVYKVESLEQVGDETVLKRSMAMWGSVPRESEEMFRQGSQHVLEGALKNYVVHGQRYGGQS